jgi:cyclic pyranopterin monophosphate synthase
MKRLTHTDSQGRAVMVDIGEKEVQKRIAKAQGHINMAPETVSLIGQNLLKKGDVLTVAQLAGINAAKQTSSLIPLCHNIIIENVIVNATLDETGVKVESEVSCTGKTGVEMEAITAVSIALVTVYDMCKAVDRNMIINNVELLSKTKT